MKTLLVILLAVCCLGSVSQLEAQTLGRLLTTPAQRAQLDRVRIQVLQPGSNAVVEDEEPEPAPEPVELNPVQQTFQLGGTLLRSDGSLQVWINGVAYNEESLPENMEILRPYARGQLRITDPVRNTSYLLKPGQTLNLTTGEIYEGYQQAQPLAIPAAPPVLEPVQ